MHRRILPRKGASALVGALCLSLVASLSGAAAAQGGARIRVEPNVQVSVRHADASHFEVLVAADPRDPDRLVVGSFIFPEHTTVSGTLVYATRDGGRTWTPTLGGEGLNFTGDPAPAYGPDGAAYYTASSLGPPGTPREQRRMLLFRSPDGGWTWEAPVSFTYSDRQYVVVDGTGERYHGRVYVNGNNREPYGISDFVVFTSTDGGRSFGGPHTRDGFGTFAADFMGNAVVRSDGTLVGVFSDQSRLHAIASTDGGMSLRPAVVIDSAFTPAGHRKGAHNHLMSLPVLAIDPSGGRFRDRMYVVWADRRSGTARILISHSADGGATWSPTRVVDDTPTGGPAEHFMPAVAVNRDGVVGVIWYDRRDHPDGPGWDVHFAASLDGGESFGPSVRVSEQGASFGRGTPWTALRSSVARRADEGGEGLVLDVTLNSFVFLGGDTAGLVADAAGVFHPVWVDNRTGVPQVWTARVRVEPQPPGTRDVTALTALEIVSNTYDQESETLTVVARLRNVSGERLRGPFVVEVREIGSQLGAVQVLGAANGATGPGAEWEIAETELAPSAATGPQTWRFRVAARPVREGDRYLMGLLRLRARVTQAASTSLAQEVESGW